MNLGLIATVAIVTIGGVAVLAIRPAQADVYAMPVKDAYQRLAAVDFGPAGEGAGGSHVMRAASGNGRDLVTWEQQGDGPAAICKVSLAPLPDDGGRTRVMVHCSGGSPAVAEGPLHAALRNEAIERVDAALTGRAFDRARAGGATAAHWPGESVEATVSLPASSTPEPVQDNARLQGRMSRADAPALDDREAGAPDAPQGSDPNPGN